MESGSFFLFIFLSCFANAVVFQNTKPNKTLNGLQVHNCSVEATDTAIRDKIGTMLEDGKKLIFIHMFLEGMSSDLKKDIYISNIYKPMEWVRTSGRFGRSVLFLRHHFEHLSVSTLSIQTEHINVNLRQTPKKCLDKTNGTVIESYFRRLLLSDFKINGDGGSLSVHEYVCNMHVGSPVNSSSAMFYYVCCQEGPDGGILCQDMVYDYWINLVFMCIFIINFLVFMFSPYLIPQSFYRKKYGENDYEHALMKPLQITIKKTSKVENTQTRQETAPYVNIQNLRHMRELCKLLRTVPTNKVVKVSLNKINLTVNYSKIIPANYVPVGIMQTFFNMFVKCNIRKTRSFFGCCKGSVFLNPFGKKNNRSHFENTKDAKMNLEGKRTNPSSSKYSWHKTLKQIMRFVMLTAVTAPWILRIYFYERYEKPEVVERQNAAAQRNLTLPYQWNLTNTLTPFHTLFIICYIIFLLDAMVLGVVSIKVKKMLQYLMRKCLRDMREASKSKAIEWSVLVLLVPCEVYGILGLFLAFLYLVFALPLIICVLAFFCLPTINLIVRLLAHVFAYLLPYGKTCYKGRLCNPCKTILEILYKYFYFDLLEDKNFVVTLKLTAKTRCQQLIILITCLCTVLSFVLLVMETITFLIEVFIYTIIGIIMNASSLLKYITFIFMLVLYARDCFKSVSDKYLDFNKSINRLVVDMNRAKVEAIARLTSDEQRNTAFQICAGNDTSVEKDTEDDTNNVKLIVKNEIPKWWTRRLVLFLDINDKPYLTEKFFLSACYMRTVGVPGPLVYNLMRALFRFLCICAFLMFVVLIVVAFGDEYQISGSNQMMATLAGGFLPWVFRNVLFKAKDQLSLDMNNLSFKGNLKTIIDDYEQSWDVSDFDISENNYQVFEDSEILSKEIHMEEGNEIDPDSMDAPMIQQQKSGMCYDLIVVDNRKATV